MTISVIIPVYNECRNIGRVVRSLQRGVKNGLLEIIVADGHSTDGTNEACAAEGVLYCSTESRSRARQMNLGASLAKGDVLYFVHADVQVHPDYLADIQREIRSGFAAGCYRCRFDSPKTALKINAYMTRFSPLWCRGGDQTLFVTRELFAELGGFRDDYIIMEDYDIIARIKATRSFRVIPKDIIVSARKYDSNSYLRVQFANFLVFTMYFWGASQPTLQRTYRKLLNYR